jgi:hypothetical protein
MLGGSKITATLAGETLEGSVAGGGVCFLLSLLRCLVVDKLIIRLSVNDCYTRFSDDIAILIIGKFPNTFSELQETEYGKIVV